MERDYRHALAPADADGVRGDHQALPQPGKRARVEALDWPRPDLPIQLATAAVSTAGDESPAMAAAMRGDPERPTLSALFGNPIQGKGIARDTAAPSVPVAATGAGRALPAPVQAKMERAFGADFSAVRVHQDGAADALGALAYTRGADIHFASGRYDPESQSGQELLGHELTHVVQQSQGRVSAPAQHKGGAINADPSLEHEADELGARAARGEVVAGSGGGAVAEAPGAGAVQCRINYDKTWAALGGYGPWHAGKQELWALVEKQYNEVFLALIGWLDGPGHARRALLDHQEPVGNALRVKLATVDEFRVHDNTNITVQVGEDIRDRLLPLLDKKAGVRALLEAWYATQLQQQHARVTELKTRLTEGADAATVHGGIKLLAKPEAFAPHQDARQQILKDLNALAAAQSPEDIAGELAKATRAGGDRTYATWIVDVIKHYGDAKKQILAARARQGLDKQAEREREQEAEQQRLEDERRELAAFEDETKKIRGWAQGSYGLLKSLFKHHELLRLAKELKPQDTGRVAEITKRVPDRDTNQPKLIELLIANTGDIKGLLALMTEHGSAFSLLAAGLTLRDATALLADPLPRRFIELYGAPAVTLIKNNSHAGALAAFEALCLRSYIQEAWLTGHLKKLVALDKAIANTPGADHFLGVYGKAGLDAIAGAPQITSKGTVDLSALREELQAGAGISYARYNPDDTSNLNSEGAEAFASDSARELAALDSTHTRPSKNLTRDDKLRVMNKKEKDVATFTIEESATFDRLKTWDDLDPKQGATLRSDDDTTLSLKVKATMQLVKKTGEVLDQELQVFVSGGKGSSSFDYTSDKQAKHTGQKSQAAKLDDLTYDVTGQRKTDYRDVDHQHIGHHDGSRKNDAEVKIVSQAVTAVKTHGKALEGATLRIFVDRYTCPNCSDLLYKAKADDKLLGTLAAIEVIYTGGRT